MKYLNNALPYVFLIIVLVFGYFLWQKGVKQDQALLKISLQIEKNNSMVVVIDSLIKQKKDSLFFYTTKTTIIERERKQNEDAILKTHDIDSLITLYYFYRPNF